MGAFLSALPFAAEIGVAADIGLETEVAADSIVTIAATGLTGWEAAHITSLAKYMLLGGEYATAGFAEALDAFDLQATITYASTQSLKTSALAWMAAGGAAIAASGGLASAAISAHGRISYYDYLYDEIGKGAGASHHPTYEDYLYDEVGKGSSATHHPSYTDYLYNKVGKEPAARHRRHSSRDVGAAVFDSYSIFVAINNDTSFNVSSLLGRTFDLSSFDRDSGTGSWRYDNATTPSGTFTGFFYETETRQSDIVVLDKQSHVDWHLNGTLEGVAPNGVDRLTGVWIAMTTGKAADKKMDEATPKAPVS